MNEKTNVNEKRNKEKTPPAPPEEEKNKNIYIPPSFKERGPQGGALSFRKPTVEEVKAYCFERDNGVNASAFVDFYEAKGWKIGKNPMKDWRAAVRTWEKRDSDGASVPRQPEAASSPTDYDGRFAWIEELKRSTTHA